MHEIDAGRPVLVSIKDHAMVGYGYNEETREIIFDDCYKSGQRMTWDGTYNYSGSKRKIQSITVIVLEENDDGSIRRPIATADVTAPTNGNVLVSAEFVKKCIIREYSLDGEKWDTYQEAVQFTDNGTIFFRGTDLMGNRTEITRYDVTNIDREPPEKPVASADVTAPTNGNVLVSAEFTEDSAVQEYSYDGETWSPYVQSVRRTKNGSVYFRAADAAGNLSEITRYDVTNIDKTPPRKPSVSADVTAATNGDVLVSAVFSEDSVSCEYSLNGKTWIAYTEAIRFSVNGTVYFRSWDVAGNVSETATYKVKNIDKTAPAKPSASASVTARTSNDVSVTAKFSKDSAVKEYSIDGETWFAYEKAVVFKENGFIFFRGTDAAGNPSEITVFEVSNIDKSMVDKGGNGYLYDKSRTPKINPDDNFVSTELKSGITEIMLDENGTTEDEALHNFVGIGDEIDYAKITLKNAAKLFFTVNSSDVVKLTVWTLVRKDGTEDEATQKSLQTATAKKVKGGTDYAVQTKLLLQAGDYYISVQSANKKNGFALYSLTLGEDSDYFIKADTSDNWTNVKSAGDGKDAELKTIGSLNDSSGSLVKDGWVGYSDAVDFRSFTLDCAAKLTFHIEATDASKFTIWKLNEKKGKEDKVTYSLKSLRSAKLRKVGENSYVLDTAELKLKKDTYYFSVESTNAKTGGSADYEVKLNTKDSNFYTRGNNADDWSDMKTAGDTSTTLVDLGVLSDSTTTVLENEWVGFGDAVD